jgi:hypothetical protein
MTIEQGKAIKINISVEGDLVGGFLVVEQTFNQFHHFIEALENGHKVSVFNVEYGDSVYKIGSAFDEEKQEFVENDLHKQGVHLEQNSEMFAFIADSKLVYIDVVSKQMFPQLIAAYLSDPVITMEEVSDDRSR